MSAHLPSTLFGDEARGHWNAIAESADREVAVIRAEQAVDEVVRQENERLLAEFLGLPLKLAPVLGVAVYSSNRKYREQAVAILLRALDRQGRVAA